ncbi:MAG: hypothetical protein HY231_01705 [Acidobacteria bacterium]|nr:hypothetical protein [Acidobacteriota bacterium]
MLTQLTHQEISLLLYALEGTESATVAGSVAEASCEEACPMVDHLAAMFGELTPEQRLINHLSNHLRDGMFACGFLEVAEKLQGAAAAIPSPEERLQMQQINRRLQTWSCEINFDAQESALLQRAFKRLPNAAWLSMPRTLWRLRKKLRAAA